MSSIVGVQTPQSEVIRWKRFPHYCPIVRGIHQSPMNSRHKGTGVQRFDASFDVSLNKRSRNRWSEMARRLCVVILLRHSVEPDQWFIRGMKLKPLPYFDPSSGLWRKPQCTEVTRVTDQADRHTDEETKPFQKPVNHFSERHPMGHGKRRQGISRGHKESKWSLLPRLISFCKGLFAHLNYWWGEISWLKCYQQQRIFTECVERQATT